MSKYFTLSKIDTNKRYNIVLGNRHSGRSYYIYKRVGIDLSNFAEYIQRGFSDTLTPQQEKVCNKVIVDMMLYMAKFRKQFEEVDTIYKEIVEKALRDQQTLVPFIVHLNKSS